MLAWFTHTDRWLAQCPLPYPCFNIYINPWAQTLRLISTSAGISDSLLDKVRSRNQWHIGVQEHQHLRFKDSYMVMKRTCVWNKTFLLGQFMLHFTTFIMFLYKWPQKLVMSDKILKSIRSTFLESCFNRTNIPRIDRKFDRSIVYLDTWKSAHNLIYNIAWETKA